MASLLDMTVRLGADTAQYKKALRQTKKDTDVWGKEIGSAMKNLAGIMAGAFTVSSIIDFGKASVQAFNESEQAGAKLLTALQGREESYSRLVKLAGELQKQTLFDDDATVEAMSFLAQMQLTEDQIKKLIPLVQDFATGQKMGLAEAAKAVGKAVQGSSGAFKKLGFEVEGAAGTSERFNSVMNTLSQSVGGQSVAAVNAGTGAVIQLNNAWGDFQENIGSKIIPALNDLSTELSMKLVVGQSENLTFLEKLWGTLDQTGLAAALMSMKHMKIEKEKNDVQEKTIEQLEVEKIAIEDKIKAGIDDNDVRNKTIDQLYELRDLIKSKTTEQLNEVKAIEKQKAAEAALYAQQLAERNSANPGVSPLPSIGAQDLGGFSTENSIFNPNVIFDPGKLDVIKTYSIAFKDQMDNLSNQAAAALKNFNDVVAAGIQSLSFALTEGIGQAIAAGGWRELFNSVLMMMADFMSEIGKQMVIIGGFLAAFDTAIATLNPIQATIAGAGLLIAAGVLKGLLRKGMGGPEAMADGGIVFGPTMALIGEYSGASNNPEVVSPLSDLKNLLGTSNKDTVKFEGKVYGSDLVFIEKQASYRTSRVRGF